MFSVLAFPDFTADDKLARLCQRLKEKHAGEPVILFIDENDITSTGNVSSTHSLKNLEDFYVICAISPISENHVRLKNTGFDLNELDICIKDKNCLCVNLYLRYRNSSSIQNLCRNIGKSLRKAVNFYYSKYIKAVLPNELIGSLRMCMINKGRRQSRKKHLLR